MARTLASRFGPRLILLLLAIVVGIAIFVAVRAPAVPVDLATVARGPLRVAVTDEGETRVRDVYVVSAPITGRLLRIDLEAGDPVARGKTVVARMVAADPAFLNPREQAELNLKIRSLEDAQAAADARITEARAERRLTASELDRVRTLSAKGFATKASLDRARAAADAARAAVVQAERAAEAARHDIETARAGLITPEQGGTTIDRPLLIRAPVSGTVLRVPQESESVAVAGQPLVEIGDPADLEIVTDLLSADAVRVRPGASVAIENWGGATPLKGKVRLIEPYGFTKLSALGVEEQRVNVLIDIAEPRAVWQRLGHGYRVIVNIEEWSSDDALRVPASALFRDGARWAVFVADGKRARLRHVEIGRMNEEHAQVIKGLAAGDKVIVHPSDRVDDDVRIDERRP